MTTLTVEIDKEKDLPALKALLNRLGLKFKISDTEWGDLSNREIEGIKEGLKDLEKGKIRSHNEVMESVQQKINNFKAKSAN